MRLRAGGMRLRASVLSVWGCSALAHVDAHARCDRAEMTCAQQPLNSAAGAVVPGLLCAVCACNAPRVGQALLRRPQCFSLLLPQQYFFHLHCLWFERVCQSTADFCSPTVCTRHLRTGGLQVAHLQVAPSLVHLPPRCVWFFVLAACLGGPGSRLVAGGVSHAVRHARVHAHCYVRVSSCRARVFCCWVRLSTTLMPPRMPPRMPLLARRCHIGSH